MNTKLNSQTFLDKSKAMDNNSVIYFNNAATSYPKPEIVNKSIIDGLYRPPIDSTRVCNCKKSKTDLDMICRESVSKFFNLSEEYEVIFTPGATYSLNIILNHFRKSGYTSAYTTNQEHNSVYRTLHALDYNIHYFSYLDNNTIDIKDFNFDNSIFVINHECNVDGRLLKLDNIIKHCKENSIPLILDITQSAGTENIDISKYNYDKICIACSAHKGLFSIPGFGFLIKPKSYKMIPFLSGGTGSSSGDSINTDSLEVGTQNYFGIVSLLAGLNYINKIGLDFVRELKKQNFLYYIDRIKRIKCFDLYDKLYKINNSKNESSGIVCLKVNSSKAIEFVNKLKDNNIIVRHGLHCSPLYHNNVLQCQSTIRLSFGIFNTYSDIDKYCDIVDKILLSNYNYYKSNILK